jgi:tetratricopeptide (TPR) repeat protein
LILALASLVVFWPVCTAEFVSLDDPLYVSGCRHVLAGLSWDSIRWAFTTFDVSNYHPLTWLSLQLDVTLFGPESEGFHRTNVLLHACNAALLLWALRVLTGSTWRSAVVAALFAVHPLHVESVAWVSERKDLLAGLFWMLTLLAYGWYGRAPRAGRYALVAVVFTLGLLAKPMAVTLPCVLLLLDYWPLGRAQPEGGSAGKTFLGRWWRTWAWLVLEKVPLLLLSAVCCYLTVRAQQGALMPATMLSPGQRLANALVAYLDYLVETFWPVGLAAFYPLQAGGPPWWEVALATSVFAGISVLCVRYALTQRYLPVGWCWYLGTLVPVIGLVQVGSQARADRYTYLPLIGIFMMLSWGGADLADRWRLPHAARVAVVCASLVACMWLTRLQLKHWDNSQALWDRCVQVNPPNAAAHNGLGMALQAAGAPERALQHYRAALALNPQFLPAQLGVVDCLQAQGKDEEAGAELDQALRLMAAATGSDVAKPIAHSRLGRIFVARGDDANAIRHFRAALRDDTTPIEIKVELARAHERRGEYAESQRLCLEVLHLEPRSALGHVALGSVLGKQGDTGAAFEKFRTALQLDPTCADAHVNMGTALARRGQFAEAEKYLREAVRLRPKDPLSQNNLGGVVEDQGRAAEALGYYEEAVRLKPDFVQAHRNLAALLEKLGRRAEADRHRLEAQRLSRRTSRGSALISQ